MLQMVGSQDKAEAALLQACSDDAASQLLYSLGIQLDISAWQALWLQRSVTTRLHSAQHAQVADNTHVAQHAHQQVLPPKTAGSGGMGQDAAGSAALDSILESMRSLAVTAQTDAEHSITQQHDQAATHGDVDTTGAHADQHNAWSQAATQCEQVIEDIRQTEFGMEVQLDALGSDLRQKQNDRLGRALHRLSQDLYSKDVHFVLELVQNADDNAYETGACPAVEFILEEHGSTIINNEVCFSQVCPVPKSANRANASGLSASILQSVDSAFGGAH